MKTTLMYKFLLGGSFFLLFADVYGSLNRELPIVVLIPSRNNNQKFQDLERYKLNLDSVFGQEYTNFRVLYIDDHSDDQTADLAEQYAKEKGQHFRFTIVRNPERYGPSRNRYMGIHLCQNHEIVVLLDGDDYFPHYQVLSKINRAYQDQKTWLTYSQFKKVPGDSLSGGKATPSWVIEKNAYREYGWYYHSLKTFYAGLFKNVKLKDLLFEGRFFPISSDLAEMLPLMEMSGGRFKFISDILYCATQYPNNEMHVFGKPLMAKMSAYILGSKPYAPLHDSFIKVKPQTDEKVDIVILWSNSLRNLDRTLKSINEQISKNKGLVTVVFDEIFDEQEEYKKIVNDYPDVKFKNISEKKTVSQDLVDTLNATKNSYVIFTSDKKHFTKKIDVARIIKVFDMTFATVCYLSLDPSNIHSKEKNLLHYIQDSVEPETKIFACQIDLVKALNNHNPFAMTFYKKTDIKAFLESSILNNKENISDIIKNQNKAQRNIGLCFEQKRSE